MRLGKKEFYVIQTVGVPIGVVVVPLSRSRSEDIEKLVANGAGFKTFDEYRSSYPGEYKILSRIWNETVGNKKCVTPTKTASMKVIKENHAGEHDYLVTASSTMSDSYPLSFLMKDIDLSECLFIMQPTVKEVLSMPGWEKTKHNELWFCKDWKEGG